LLHFIIIIVPRETKTGLSLGGGFYWWVLKVGLPSDIWRVFGYVPAF